MISYYYMVNYLNMGLILVYMVEQEREGRSETDLLIFNYAPNLRVVGGFHALDEEDKSILEALIDECDFVALETDEVHIKNNMNLTIIKSESRRGWNEKEQALCLGPFDTEYIKAYSNLNKKFLQIINTSENSPRVRDIKSNEIQFSYNCAKQKGKDVYLVDMPKHEIMLRLCDLSIFRKIHHIWYMIDLECSAKLGVRQLIGLCLAVENILGRDREEYMLEQIAQEEGPLEKMERKGVLVVGRNHAENYLRSLTMKY